MTDSIIFVRPGAAGTLPPPTLPICDGINIPVLRMTCSYLFAHVVLRKFQRELSFFCHWVIVIGLRLSRSMALDVLSLFLIDLLQKLQNSRTERND